MIIRTAEFVKSSAQSQQCPAGNLPEYAFAGRSNVGKSSLLNMLAGKKLAKTSAAPGKTQLINHFLINGKWYLTDLPGYGYARTGKALRTQFAKIIWDYLRQRLSLTLLFALIDCRLPPQPIDMEFIQRLGECAVPFYIVFTKTDKVSMRAAARTADLWKKTLLASWESLPPFLFASSAKGQGREEILQAIEQINNEIK